MKKTETVNDIIESWETDGSMREWWAVDEYDGRSGRVIRLFVGSGERAREIAAGRASGAGLVDDEGRPAEPGEFGQYPFFRATVIDPRAARDYLLAVTTDADGIGEMLTMQQAADELGITRQGAYDLAKRGKLPSEECVGTRIGRYSVILRNAARRGR